jgi:hypothetical protein
VPRTADLDDSPLGVVADEAGPVVGVRQIVGDQSVHLGHEVDRQPPARIERSLSAMKRRWASSTRSASSGISEAIMSAGISAQKNRVLVYFQ